MPIKCTVLCARLTLGVAVATSVVMTPVPAFAQSAADKATARKLATAGIKLYQEQKYEEALDKLRRAQELYDAPVHVLYMARCQVKLGKLVEGTESYRKLVRTELEPNAPEVFQVAITDGEKELAEVEPRVPTLTINVEPSTVPELRILVDGEPVSAAALGVERPVNPGQVVVVAEAPGYLSTEASATLEEGQTKQVSLTLEVDPNAPKPSPETTKEGGEGQVVKQPGTEDKPGEEDWRTAEISAGAVGFFIGVRGGALFPVGNLEDSRSTADYLGISGGAELHGGVRFYRNFGVKLFFERYWSTPGPALESGGTAGLEESAYEVTSEPHVSGFGISAIAGTQRGRIGGYGELGLALAHEYGWEREFVDPDALTEPNFSKCTETTSYSGPALRLGGAFVFPVHPNFQLSASAVVTLGNFSTMKFASDCKIPPATESLGETETDIAKQGLHQQIFLGVGADFMFGPG